MALSRLSTADVVREAQRAGIVATVSDKTVWRWLHEDAIRPLRHRTWIFPCDPQFAVKAGRILDLYAPADMRAPFVPCSGSGSDSWWDADPLRKLLDVANVPVDWPTPPSS